MLFDELHSQKEQIEALAQIHGAKSIRVFGSVARGEERPDSDIDFLVDFDPGYDLFLQRIPLAEKLAKLTGHAVDLIPIHELNEHIADTILAESKFL